MEIKRAGSQASAKSPAEWFTGTVRIDPLFQAPDQHWFRVRASLLNRGPALLGTRIRSGKP